jgi:hypothetical protein
MATRYATGPAALAKSFGAGTFKRYWKTWPWGWQRKKRSQT